MSDSRRPSEGGIERDLRDLGSRIDYPPTPDLARSVRLRLDEEDAGQQARRGRYWPSSLSPRWAVTAAALVLISFALLSPAVRATLSDFFVSGQAASSGGGAAVSEAGGSAARPESGGSAARPGQQAKAGSEASRDEARPESGGGSVAPQSSMAESAGGTAAQAGATGCPSPSLGAEPARAAPGATFRLRGNGFFSGCDEIRPAHDVRIDFRQDGKTWKLATVDADRRLSLGARLRVPAGAEPGQATVRATTRSGALVEERFLVLR